MERGDLADLQIFMGVVRSNSFKLAAIDLGLTTSAVSHAIRRLELRLGARLLNRTSRAVATTAMGQELADKLGSGFEIINAAVASLNAPGSSKFGELRLNVFADAAHQLISPALIEFSGRYPDVKFTLIVDDHPVDIIAEGYDAGVRYGHLVPEDMIAVPLTGPQRWVVVASPGYLKQHGTPQTPADLRRHNCLQLLLGNNAPFRWEFGSGATALCMSVPGLITVKDTATTIDLAKAGVGLAYLLESRICNEISAGELVMVLEAYAAPEDPFHMYYSNRRHGHPALRQLINIVRIQNGLSALPVPEYQEKSN
ncbi:LysR family transcriptional regulator [Serratia marcescens]|nr:LysR family transcriptional regulator [Serratia marcescens]MBH2865756.1 LysR family transcriptional regulator [Serratia marcescens]MBW4239690.1 LysR family transcriptional regulator [Enterobacter roggenkampii]